MRKLHVLAAAAAMTASSLFADVQIGKGLSVGGYLDMVYQRTSPDGAGAANADTSGFSYTTAEFNFMMDFGGGLSAQVDLEGNAGNDQGDPDTGDIELEQAKIMYTAGQGTFTFGKQDAFIGLEGLEAPDLYQYSTSLTWEEEFTQHEGVSYAWDNGTVNFAAGVFNSLYSDNANAGSDDELSYAAHIGFTPSEALSLNLNYATEDTGAAGFDQDFMSFDVSYSNHGWTVGAEYVMKDIQQGVGAGDQERTAWMLMANYMFTEQFGLTGRISTLEADNPAGATISELQEFTVAASYAITPNWFALVEYRTQEDDKDMTNAARNNFDQITLETLLTF